MTSTVEVVIICSSFNSSLHSIIKLFFQEGKGDEDVNEEVEEEETNEKDEDEDTDEEKEDEDDKEESFPGISAVEVIIICSSFINPFLSFILLSFLGRRRR